jgi:hypothetical protein
MDLGKIGWGDVDWIGVVQERGMRSALVDAVIKLRVP